MPCQYCSDHEVSAMNRAALDNLTSMLCELCQRAEADDLHDSRGEPGCEEPLITPRIREWWNDHKRRDAEAAQAKADREERIKQDKAARAEALAQLTPAQRRTLNLE